MSPKREKRKNKESASDNLTNHSKHIFALPTMLRQYTSFMWHLHDKKGVKTQNTVDYVVEKVTQYHYQSSFQFPQDCRQRVLTGRRGALLT